MVSHFSIRNQRAPIPKGRVITKSQLLVLKIAFSETLKNEFATSLFIVLVLIAALWGAANIKDNEKKIKLIT